MTVPRSLRLKLAAARAEGLRFDQAWDAALGGALSLAPPYERGDWRSVLAGDVEEWRAAFEGGDPTALGAALGCIDPDEHQSAEARCVHCDGPLPQGTKWGSLRRYCRASCREAAKRGRSRARADAATHQIAA